ncbi:MAG: T9SS type A sorting domain-containing protein [Candidatus Margulisiibacteriota bacterium]
MVKRSAWLFVILLTVSVINYPNPFNPKGGESTTFECSSDANLNASIYLYDMTAKLLWHKAFPLQNGTTKTSWNGYSDENEQVKNGVYLYRIVSDKSTVSKGKVWVVNQ